MRLYFAAALCLALPASADPVAVATDIPPVASLVAMVQDGRGSTVAIAEGAGDPHHVTLRPSQARALAQAGLAISIGPGLTPWFDKALSRLAPEARTIVLAEQAPHRLDRREAMVETDEAHADHDHDHHHHDHDDDTDPHLWLDAENAVAWLDIIAEALAEADPDGADTYRKNAASAAVEIAQVEASLAPATPDFHYLAAHDSFQYAETLTGAVFAGALSDSHDVAPGPAHVAALKTRLGAGDIACILSAPSDTTKLARQLAKDHGLPLVEVDILAGGIPYPALMSAWHMAITSCRTETG